MVGGITLEIKSISITRLKLKTQPDFSVRPVLTWNQKHLDYEIETLSPMRSSSQPHTAWNQKHLDYEIETSLHRELRAQTAWNLKSKASRLRDWNISSVLTGRCFSVCLKSKASRLRDWNLDMPNPPAESGTTLEIKSISITRLKLASNSVGYHSMRNLKSKASRLRDWNQNGEMTPIGSGEAWNQKHLDYEIETW